MPHIQAALSVTNRSASYDATHGGSLLSSKVLRAIRRKVFNRCSNSMPLSTHLNAPGTASPRTVPYAYAKSPGGQPQALDRREASRVPLDSSGVPPDGNRSGQGGGQRRAHDPLSFLHRS
jgi:hypothetical protein